MGALQVKWERSSESSMKCGPWTLIRYNDPAGVLKMRYELLLNKKVMGYFRTSKEAMQEAEYLEATQI